MSAEIKMIGGIVQFGNAAVSQDIECRVRCENTLDVISLHAQGMVMSLPLKQIEKLVEKARKNEK